MRVEVELVELAELPPGQHAAARAHGVQPRSGPIAVFYPPADLPIAEFERLMTALQPQAQTIADFSSRVLVDALLERGGRALRELAQLLDPRF